MERGCLKESTGEMVESNVDLLCIEPSHRILDLARSKAGKGANNDILFSEAIQYPRTPQRQTMLSRYTSHATYSFQVEGVAVLRNSVISDGMGCCKETEIISQ